MPTPVSKAEMRNSVQQALSVLSPEGRRSRTDSLCDRLEPLIDAAEPGVLLTYLSLHDEASVDRLIRQRLVRSEPVAAPVVDWTAGLMRAVRVSDLDLGVRIGRHGLREPIGDPDDPADLTCILVPGVAFDALGGRLGRGGGFYDRFLATIRDHRSSPLLIGVAFDEQIVPKVPMEEHDMPLDVIVTSTRVLRRHAPPTAR